jgi:hypothetical protein
MGNRAHGIVFWGFPHTNEKGKALPLPWEREDDDEGIEPQDFYAKQNGVVYDTSSDLFDMEAYRNLISSCPVIIERAGSDSELISLVAIKDSYVEVQGSQVTAFHPVSPIWDSWDEKLRSYCETVGIEWRVPGWHVATLYL